MNDDQIDQLELPFRDGVFPDADRFWRCQEAIREYYATMTSHETITKEIQKANEIEI